MIRAILLDVDGVIVGEKVGYNAPDPHPDVMERMKAIHASGTPIILCTGKPYYSVMEIVKSCNLNTPIISNGGSEIIDPKTRLPIKKHVMDPSLVRDMVRAFLDAGIYTEVYTPEEYVIQKDQVRQNLTPGHSLILGKEPRMVDDLVAETSRLDVVKLLPVAVNDADKPRLLSIYEPFKDRTILSWGVHPVLNPHRFALITKAGVSKRQSSLDAMDIVGIPITDCLGVGDSASDWQFMELCGYAAAMGNAGDELKRLVMTKGKKGLIGPGVDENGILKIFDQYGLYDNSDIRKLDP